MNKNDLERYLAQQLCHLLPDTNVGEVRPVISAHLPATLDRLHHLIQHVKMWTPGKFDHLHSTQYCTFLYLLSNEIFAQTGERELPTRLFLLNKALNAIDLFYEIDLHLCSSLDIRQGLFWPKRIMEIFWYCIKTRQLEKKSWCGANDWRGCRHVSQQCHNWAHKHWRPLCIRPRNKCY